MRLPIKVLIPFVALAIATAACSSLFSASAAVVNGRRIGIDEVEARIAAALQQSPAGTPEARSGVARDVLLGLIHRELLRGEAERRGIRVPDGQVEAQFRQLRQAYGDERFAQALRQAGVTEDDVRRDIRDQLLVEELREQVSPISDARVRQQYEREKESFREVRVRHILISTESRSREQALAMARAALERIRGGEAFAEVARDVSEDPSSKEQGGELGGFVPVNRLDPAFGRAAWAARPGQLVGPVLSQFGYHLIVTIQKRYRPFADAEAEIRESLTETESNPRLSELLRSLMEDAEVVVNPRYGNWDPSEGQIVEPRFFEPPTVEPNAPNPPLGGGTPQP